MDISVLIWSHSLLPPKEDPCPLGHVSLVNGLNIDHIPSNLRSNEATWRQHLRRSLLVPPERQDPAWKEQTGAVCDITCNSCGEHYTGQTARTPGGKDAKSIGSRHQLVASIRSRPVAASTRSQRTAGGTLVWTPETIFEQRPPVVTWPKSWGRMLTPEQVLFEEEGHGIWDSRVKAIPTFTRKPFSINNGFWTCCFQSKVRKCDITIPYAKHIMCVMAELHSGLLRQTETSSFSIMVDVWCQCDVDAKWQLYRKNASLPEPDGPTPKPDV